MYRPAGRRTGRVAVLLVCASLALPVCVLGARQATSGPLPHADTVEAPLNTGGMWRGGLLGWTGGFLVGGISGYWIEVGTTEPNEYQGIGGFMLGAFTGATLLTPILTHAKGGGEGHLGVGLAASALAGALGVAVIAASDGHLLLVLPVGQIWASVSAEKRTAERRRARR